MKKLILLFLISLGFGYTQAGLISAFTGFDLTGTGYPISSVEIQGNVFTPSYTYNITGIKLWFGLCYGTCPDVNVVITETTDNLPTTILYTSNAINSSILSDSSGVFSISGTLTGGTRYAWYVIAIDGIPYEDGLIANFYGGQPLGECYIGGEFNYIRYRDYCNVVGDVSPHYEIYGYTGTVPEPPVTTTTQEPLFLLSYNF